MFTPQYFRLAVISQNNEEIEKVGDKVFENHRFGYYDGLSNNQMFINIIFSFLAQQDIAAAEEELINRGFAVIDVKQVPENLIEKIPRLICKRDYEKQEGAFNKQDGIEFLNRSLPLMADSLAMYLKRK